MKSEMVKIGDIVKHEQNGDCYRVTAICGDGTLMITRHFQYEVTVQPGAGFAIKDEQGFVIANFTEKSHAFMMADILNKTEKSDG